MNTPTPMPGTALPWSQHLQHIKTADRAQTVVGRCFNALDAAYIVWACNNAPALLSALEKARDELLWAARRLPPSHSGAVEKFAAEADTALASAGGRNG